MVGVNGLQRRRVPPYYAFIPTDEQLIVHYLGNYVAGQPLPYDGVIGSADVYGTEPYNLLPSPLKSGGEAYFFSPRTRGRRTAGGGTWRLECKEDIADGEGEVVGYKGMLSFRSSHNTRKATGWVMHEYVLGDQDDDRANFKPVALYRIHRKPSKEDKDQEDQEDQESPVATPDQEPEQGPGPIGSLMALPAPEPTVTIEYQTNSFYDVEVAPPIDDQNDGGFSSEPSATAGYCGAFFDSQATVQPTNTIGLMALPAPEPTVTIEYQNNSFYDVEVAPPIDDQNDGGFSSEPSATTGHCGGFFESHATVQPTNTIGLMALPAPEPTVTIEYQNNSFYDVEVAPPIDDQNDGGFSSEPSATTGHCGGFFESHATVQPTNTIGLMALPAPEPTVTIEYQNNSFYDVEVAPPIDDQNDGGFSSEPSATTGYCGGFFEPHATVQPTNTIGSSVALPSEAPVTVEYQSNRCYDVTVAPPTDGQNHAGFSSEPATAEYNGGFFESFARVWPTSTIGSSMGSPALITGDSDGVFESYAAVQPTSRTSMASLAAPEAAASDNGNGLLNEIGKNSQQVDGVPEIPKTGVASDGGEMGLFAEQWDDLAVTMDELLGSYDDSCGADELDTWPDVSSMVGWAF